MPFSVGHGQFLLNEARLDGPVLSANMRGKIDFRSQNLNVGGTFTPLAGLNTMFRGSPLFGPLLTGPRGDGVFAMTFAIQGSMSAPQIIVNPFSVITPGVTREIMQMAPETQRIVPRDRPQGRSEAGPRASRTGGGDLQQWLRGSGAARNRRRLVGRWRAGRVGRRSASVSEGTARGDFVARGRRAMVARARRAAALASPGSGASVPRTGRNMDKRKLGNSGLEIAPLIFGGNVLGWTADAATLLPLLDGFVAAGFEGIDTADVYPNGCRAIVAANPKPSSATG